MQLKSIAKEPLLHFLAIGAALFLLFHLTGGGSGPTSSRIVISPSQIEYLVTAYAKTWQRPPSEAELKTLIDEWVREEIAVREAIANGLDRDDTVIRRRLRQKIEFLSEDSAELTPPTDQELQAWLSAHAEAFQTEPKLRLRQVFLSNQRRGSTADADAKLMLSQLKASGPEARIDQLGDPTLLPQEVGLAPLRDIDKIFGAGFAKRIGDVSPGDWAGPISSSYGLHLVLVQERVEPAAPDLATLRPSVERQFMADRRKKELAAMYQRMLSKYTIVVEARAPVSAASSSAREGL